MRTGNHALPSSTGPTLTLNLILDALPDFDVAHMPSRANVRISWCQAVFDHPASYPQPDLDERNVLYVADSSNGIDALRNHPDSVVAIALAQDDLMSAEELLAAVSPDEADRALILTQPEEPLTIACIISLVQLRIQKVKDWDLMLKVASNAQESVQSLCDLGEEMFGNFMHVSDGSYVLLGYTKGIEPSGTLNSELVRRGYHDATTIDHARKTGVFGQWEKQRGVQVFEPNEEIPHPFMTYVMKHQGQYCGHVVMVCNHASPTPQQIDLFEIFALACNDVVKRMIAGNSQIKPHFHDYLTRLITDSRVSQDFIINQSTATGIPAEGWFRLAAIDTEDEELSGQLPFLMSSLVQLDPSYLVFLHKGTILVLACSKTSPPEMGQQAQSELAKFCTANGCLAYVSDYFWRIRDIRLAYQQTQVTRKHRRSVDIWLRPFDSIALRHVFDFDDVFAFACLGDDCSSEFRSYCFGHSALERLLSPQSNDGISDLRFLHCYLLNERRPSPTANQLGLHRNSILYRARCLKERYGIDLDRACVRERLALCLRLKITNDTTLTELLTIG